MEIALSEEAYRWQIWLEAKRAFIFPFHGSFLGVVSPVPLVVVLSRDSREAESIAAIVLHQIDIMREKSGRMRILATWLLICQSTCVSL